MNRKVTSCPLVLWLSVLAIGPGCGAEISTDPQDMAANASLTTMDIQYKGPLISDTCVPGEGKSAGIAPELSSCVQASRDRWIILFGTVDPRGHDINRSIFYQIRKGAPNGEVLKEDIIEKAKSDWDPLGVGHSFRKINAVVKVFGVPKGALRDGKPISTANHFVAKWYIRPCIEIDGRLVNLWHKASLVNPDDLGRYAYGLEWMQFRLNDTEDDIEIISPAKELRQKRCDHNHNISSLGSSMGMHHGFGDAVPNDDFTEWVEVCQFETYPPSSVAMNDRPTKVAAVRYSFHPTSGLYEWVETGKSQQIPNRRIAEASLNKINNFWVISIRAYNAQQQTSWYRTSDPFASFGDKTDIKSSYAPRISFVCADGILRVFCNDTSPHGVHSRDPLYCFDVDPITFEYSNRRVVLDAHKQRLPFRTPFIDHAMIYPHPGGRKQIISFRTINRSQTTAESTTPEELERSGIHYSELIYDRDYPTPWGF